MPDEARDELWTAEEVAGVLRISVDTLNRLIKSGEFPNPLEISPGAKFFQSEDVRYYRLRTKVKSRLSKGGKDSADV